MTLNELQKGALVLFAAREAIDTGSLSAMKAVCFIIRNRVKAGWHDGNWLTCIEYAPEVAGNLPPENPRILDLNERALQLLARDVDGIFQGTTMDDLASGFGDPGAKGTRPALYYQFMNRPATPWFQKHIVNDRRNHAIRTRLDPMVFFE